MKEKKSELANNQTIKIDLGFATLVAEKSTDPMFPREIFICLEAQDGSCLQDIAVVGQRYHYNKDDKPIFEDGLSVKVWSDKDSEDYTHEFDIDPYKEEVISTFGPFENVKDMMKALSS